MFAPGSRYAQRPARGVHRRRRPRSPVRPAAAVPVPPAPTRQRPRDRRRASGSTSSPSASSATPSSSGASATPTRRCAPTTSRSSGRRFVDPARGALMEGAAYTLLLGDGARAGADSSTPSRRSRSTARSRRRARFACASAIDQDRDRRLEHPRDRSVPAARCRSRSALQRGIVPPEAVINGYVSRAPRDLRRRPGRLDARGHRPWTRRSLMNLEEKVIAVAEHARQRRSRPRSSASTQLIPQVDADLAGARRARGHDDPARAPTSASCGAWRGATVSTATSSPSRSPASTSATSKARSLSGLPDAVLSASFGDDTNVCDFNVRYDADAARPRRSPPASTQPRRPPQPAPAPRRRCSCRSASSRRCRASCRRRSCGRSDIGLPRTPRAAGARRRRSSIARRGRSSREERSALDVALAAARRLVNVRGCGRLYNGSYFVTRVRHMIDDGELRAALRGAPQRGQR